MMVIGNKYKKCIYAYEFEKTKTVYVGLTFNIEVRNEQHLKHGPVYNYLKNGITPLFKILTDYIDVEEAKIKEQFFVDEYKGLGWKVLNSAKPGAIGGGIIKWTLEKCIADAKTYKCKKDYRNDSKGYRAAVRNNWLEIIYKECGFELKNSKPHKYWTKERIFLELDKCDNIKEFRKLKNRVPYSVCQRHKWLTDIKNYKNWN